MLTYFTFRPTKTHIARFLLSLALATFLWGWVTQLQDPFQDKSFYNVPIQITDLPDNLQVITTLPSATVTLSGAESDLRSIANVNASLDVSNISGPGEYQVPVRVKNLDGVTDRKVEPNEIQIQVEVTQSKVFPIEVDPTSLEAGDSRRIAGVKPTVSQVTVTGSSSAVGRVAKVQLPVKVDQQTSTFTADLVPVAMDANGQPITEVTLLPATVSAEITIETRGKQVSVVPQIVGLPAEGYSVQQRAALPESIIIDGPQAELDKLLFVDTEPVDISGAKESISRRVGIADLPQGLTIVTPEDGTVEVRVAVEDTTLQATVFSALEIEPIGLDSTLTAEITPVKVDVSVNAPRSLLQSLKANDVKVLVDLTGLGPGTYTTEPNVIVPQGVTWLGNKPDRVKVVIVRKEQSTPASPAATPATPVGRSEADPAPLASDMADRRIR